MTVRARASIGRDKSFPVTTVSLYPFRILKFFSHTVDIFEAENEETIGGRDKDRVGDIVDEDPLFFQSGSISANNDYVPITVVIYNLLR
jgi:hypothetical protein